METLILIILFLQLLVQLYTLWRMPRSVSTAPVVSVTPAPAVPVDELRESRLRMWIPMFRKFSDANLQHFAPMPGFWIFKLKYRFMMSRMTPERVVDMAREHLMPYKGHEDALVRYIETRLGWDPGFLEDPVRARVVDGLKKYVRVLWELV
jgi:hypothetical protein